MSANALPEAGERRERAAAVPPGERESANALRLARERERERERASAGRSAPQVERELEGVVGRLLHRGQVGHAGCWVARWALCCASGWRRETVSNVERRQKTERCARGALAVASSARPAPARWQRAAAKAEGVSRAPLTLAESSRGGVRGSSLTDSARVLVRGARPSTVGLDLRVVVF
jgi:hypothetical protein